jgi:hypothetical protein
MCEIGVCCLVVLLVIDQAAPYASCWYVDPASRSNSDSSRCVVWAVRRPRALPMRSTFPNLDIAFTLALTLDLVLPPKQIQKLQNLLCLPSKTLY